MKTPYVELKRDCQQLHGFESKDLKNFIDLAKISEGMIILDAMCGNGVLSNELSKLKIDLYLLDNSEFQLNLAKKAVGKAKFFVGSILKTPFENEKFDRVFQKAILIEQNAKKREDNDKFNLVNANIEKRDQINNMYIDSIKAKLSIFDELHKK